MGFCVCGGAMCSCSFGMAPSALMVLPKDRVISTMPVATIMDYKPMVNILPFGMCQSPANPVVVAATAAAAGVLTPMPCIPNTIAPWVPGNISVLVANKPILTNSSKLMCMWGGVISVTNPACQNIQV